MILTMWFWKNWPGSQFWRSSYFPTFCFILRDMRRRFQREEIWSKCIEELTYFRDEMLCLHRERKLADDELIDFMGFVNTIIVHITDGNESEEGGSCVFKTIWKTCWVKRKVKRLLMTGGHPIWIWMTKGYSIMVFLLFFDDF